MFSEFYWSYIYKEINEVFNEDGNADNISSVEVNMFVQSWAQR